MQLATQHLIAPAVAHVQAGLVTQSQSEIQ